MVNKCFNVLRLRGREILLQEFYGNNMTANTVLSFNVLMKCYNNNMKSEAIIKVGGGDVHQMH